MNTHTVSYVQFHVPTELVMRPVSAAEKVGVSCDESSHLCRTDGRKDRVSLTWHVLTGYMCP